MVRRLTPLFLSLLAAAAPAQQASDRDALEHAFAERMTGAVLVGRFTDDTRPGEAPAEDRYTLGKVEKKEGDQWSFQAQVDYGGKQFPVAVLVDVLWAGDTPVLTMTDRKIPLVGTFTVRLMFHGDLYAGTWRGADHGGHMWGRVEHPAAAAPAAGGADRQAASWPRFRGPSAGGVAHVTGLPDSFDVGSGEHVAWRVEVPGLCHSSPIVWGDRVYVTTAVKEGGEPAELRVGLYGDTKPVQDESAHQYRVLCFDAATGAKVWDVLAWEGVPAVKRHPKGSHVASTPTTDGEHVVCLFGSEGLYCFDRDGALLWKKDLGPLVGGWFQNKDQWGYSSSPVLFEDKVLVQCDVLDRAFVAAFRVSDGEQLWRAERDEVPGWGTPTVDVRPGRRQVVVNGYKHMAGYDVDTGEELWSLGGGGDIPVPTPVVAHDLVFLTNAHGMMAPIYAIDAMASGRFTRKDPQMVWQQTRGGNYMQTPLVLGDRLYLCSDAGIMTCLEAATGTEVWRERLGEGGAGFTASIVATDDRIYATSEEGDVYAIAPGAKLEVVGRGDLGEEAMATPAIAGGTLFWRTRGHLVAVR